MPKFVCEFETVSAIGDQVCNSVAELENAVSTYSSHIEGDLNSWTGDAKNAFTTTNASTVQTATTDLAYVKELGEFIKKASQSIKALEEELASLSI